MDPLRARYVVRFYDRFMSEPERLAYRHLAATGKLMHGSTDLTAQEKAKTARPQLLELLSDDPEVLQLAAGGLVEFILRTAERICRDHHEQITFNNCPRCGELAKTPKARQCRYCGHDWHSIDR
jgi:hypothetical protein